MQCASTVLMVRPASFGFNTETAANNYFQDKGSVNNDLQRIVLKEFDAMSALLMKHGINVWIIDDTKEPVKPDAIFPNNWFSCMNDTLTLFPMYAGNRRIEKREDIVQFISSKKSGLKLNDLGFHESTGKFLEGTGSIVCDHINKIMYACISPRTDKTLFEDFSKTSGYESISFEATDDKGRQVYHTNVMMCIGDRFAVVCTDAITNASERNKIIETFISTQHEIIDIGLQQMNRFAGNMLQLTNKNNEHFIVMSRNAFESLTTVQLDKIKKYATPLVSDVSTIERTGGGSVRCMIAEIFI
jgi:hypothetical protein